MQVANTNVYTIMDQSEEKKEALWAAWERDEGLEDLLRLTIQEVETQKVKHPELNISTSYQMGRLDGYTELLERLFRARECDKAIRNNPGLQTEKSQHILDILYKMGEALHVDLADAVGSSYSSLTEEMKEMLLSGAVEATRFGRNTRYCLTHAGRRYYEQVLLKKAKLTAPAIKVAGAVSLLSGLAHKAEERALFRSDNEEDLYLSVRIHSILQPKS